MKVVVTGGAGFIGSNLCRHLRSRPGVGDVVVIDDLSTGRRENLDGLDVVLVEADIAERAVLDECFEGAGCIVHLAARGSVPRSIADPVGTHTANATGTLEVLEAARRAGDVHTIVASSSSVYGATAGQPKTEDLPTRPMSPYAASKLATEWYALSYQHALSLPVLALRFFNVFGPRQPADHAYAAVIPRFVHAALSGSPLTVYGDGRQTRDFTYVDTVCATITRAVLDKVSDPEPVNLAFGQPLDLLTVVATLEDVLGTRLHVRHADPRPGDVRHSRAGTARLEALFPGTEPVPFRVGLERTVEWFRSR